jgi:hypothetical protein
MGTGVLGYAAGGYEETYRAEVPVPIRTEAKAASIPTPATAADTTYVTAVTGYFARVPRILLMCFFHRGAIGVSLQDLEH